MSRRVNRPAQVVLVPDPVHGHGHRPAEVRWTDRNGWSHYLAISKVLDDFRVSGQWWESAAPPGQRQGYRYWRMQVGPAGEVLLCEDLDQPAGSPQRWQVTSIQD